MTDKTYKPNKDKLYLVVKSLNSDIDSLNNFEVSEDTKVYLYKYILKAVGGNPKPLTPEEEEELRRIESEAAGNALRGFLPWQEELLKYRKEKKEPPKELLEKEAAYKAKVDAKRKEIQAQSPEAKEKRRLEFERARQRRAGIIDQRDAEIREVGAPLEEQKRGRQILENVEQNRPYDEWREKLYRLQANVDGLPSSRQRQELYRHLEQRPGAAGSVAAKPGAENTSGATKPTLRDSLSATFNKARGFFDRIRENQEAKNQSRADQEHAAETARNQDIYNQTPEKAAKERQDQLARLGLLSPNLQQERSDQALDALAKRMEEQRQRDEEDAKRIKAAGGDELGGVSDQIKDFTRSINSYINSRIKFYEGRLDEK